MHRGTVPPAFNSMHPSVTGVAVRELSASGMLTMLVIFCMPLLVAARAQSRSKRLGAAGSSGAEVGGKEGTLRTGCLPCSPHTIHLQGQHAGSREPRTSYLADSRGSFLKRVPSLP